MTPLLTLRETREILGVSLATMYRILAQRELLAIRLGGSIRIHPKDLEAYIDSKRERRTGPRPMRHRGRRKAAAA